MHWNTLMYLWDLLKTIFTEGMKGIKGGHTISCMFIDLTVIKSEIFWGVQDLINSLKHIRQISSLPIQDKFQTQVFTPIYTKINLKIYALILTKENILRIKRNCHK